MTKPSRKWLDELTTRIEGLLPARIRRSYAAKFGAVLVGVLVLMLVVGAYVQLQSGDIVREDTRAQLKPEALWEAETGLGLMAADVQRASELRTGWYHRALELFERYDALVLPTAQVWPFPLKEAWPRAIGGQTMDSYHRWMEVVVPASLIGLPAVAVPAGFGERGMPMGLQIIGAPGADQAVLELAEAWHGAMGPAARTPVA